MTPEQFAYWLQGFVEISDMSLPPNSKEWQVIKDHLATVFKKVTPLTYGPGIVTTPTMPKNTPPNWPNSEIIC